MAASHAKFALPPTSHYLPPSSSCLLLAYPTLAQPLPVLFLPWLFLLYPHPTCFLNSTPYHLLLFSTLAQHPLAYPYPHPVSFPNPTFTVPTPPVPYLYTTSSYPTLTVILRVSLTIPSPRFILPYPIFPQPPLNPYLSSSSYFHPTHFSSPVLSFAFLLFPFSCFLIPSLS